MEMKIHSYKEVNYEDKNVLLRIDNCVWCK
jgi:hypothetical protein